MTRGTTSRTLSKGEISVALADVIKSYRLDMTSVVALRGVSLSIAAGAFVVVRGPSGSGKTTLLNLLGCIDAPDAGCVRLNGIDVSSLLDRQRTAFRAEHVGFVFQNFNLVPVLTALENVAYPLQLLGLPSAECRQRAHAALNEVGLAGMHGRFPAALSGGQRQRVAVARALVKRPALILADEPTANLDQETGAQLIALMRSIQRATGCTFIFSSHDPKLIADADQQVLLRDGSVIDVVRRRDLFRQPRAEGLKMNALSF
jgi:putative ABC transport system ATP-binding protein